MPWRVLRLAGGLGIVWPPETVAERRGDGARAGCGSAIIA